MEKQSLETEKRLVPLYAKVGWIGAWVVMLGLAVMILRNCATSVYYGVKTDQQAVDAAFQSGVRDGGAGKAQALDGTLQGNSVLKKAYIKGYREGADKLRGPGKTAP